MGERCPISIDAKPRDIRTVHSKRSRPDRYSRIAIKLRTEASDILKLSIACNSAITLNAGAFSRSANLNRDQHTFTAPAPTAASSPSHA